MYLLHEVPTLMEKFESRGTIGYALGSQLAGVLYQYVSPMAIFIAFIGVQSHYNCRCPFH